MSGQVDHSEIVAMPLGRRLFAYSKMTGPGYLQSAMTLGGGSVASCAALGSLFGYKYLWVQIIAMVFGYFVLASITKQTCHSEERAYAVFQRELHPVLAIVWALSAMVATLIWHIPQYSLTANGVVALAEGAGMDLDGRTARVGIGIVVLALAAGVVSLYHSGAKGLKIYERVIKTLVWGIVLAFAIAVVSGDPIDWGAAFFGVTGITFLQDLMASGVEPEAVKPVIGALAAAVGINMVFLYPYSLQQKGWGKDHKELAYFDLITGMAIPFIIATSLMILAVAKTIGPEPGALGTEVRDIRQIIPVLSPSLGEGLSTLLIGAGITAIGFSTIITHMLAVGFTGCEMFGLSHEGSAKRWFSLLPAIGVIGVAIKFPIPLAITASTLALPLMPVTVVCFLILLNRPSFMGDEMPRGAIRFCWNAILITTVIVMSGAAIIALQKNWASLQNLLSSTEAARHFIGDIAGLLG